ncbi:MAG: hypothetical protein ACYS0I_09610 [Planctomycetota bacterium]|jgi:hypothetical protein
MKFKKKILITVIMTIMLVGANLGGVNDVLAETAKITFIGSSFGTSSYILGEGFIRT